MGYGVFPLAVEHEALASALTNGGESMAEAIFSEYADEDRFDDEELEDLRAAMGELFNGQFDSGRVYGYAFKAVCLFFGEHLDNEYWNRTSVDAVCAAEKVLPASNPIGEAPLQTLFFERDVFGNVPRSGDYPHFAYLRPAEVAAFHAALEGQPLRAADDYIQGMVEECAGWLAECATSGRALAMFWY